MRLLDWINEYVIWGTPMLVLFLGTGVVATVKFGFKQFNLPKIFRKTILAKHTDNGGQNLTPFQTLTSTLAVTLGTGNIVAVGSAIALGGAGAVFWMWVSAIIGMATAYAENFFGMKTRRQAADGSYYGGAYFYIEKTLNKGWAVFFAVCCMLTGIGMGNMTQMNALATAMKSTFSIPTWMSGIMATAIVGIMVFGGAKFLGEVTEKVIPVMSIFYIVGCVLVIALNVKNVPAAFAEIVTSAFDLRSVGGGLLGSAMLRGMNWGLRRGVYSNEAGLGSSVILNTMTSEQDADKQSNWAMLCVFIDTIVMCTLTAFAILLTGVHNQGGTQGGDGTDFATMAFSGAFGGYATAFVTICIVMFAMATASGWAVFGRSALQYLCGKKWEKLYLCAYVGCCFLGAVMSLDVVWGLADLTNGLMAVPNLLSILMLSCGKDKKLLKK